MREHPIPQDITSYRFHIIGSMTLKQFGEVFLGVIVALIFYKTNLFFPIKWFFVLASVGLGAAAAFVPIEERPLDHWIITFFKILYKPTQFFWRKEPTIPPAFLYEPQSDAASQAPEIDLAPIRRGRIKEYLRSVSTPATTSDQPGIADQTERIQSILEAFKTQPTLEPTRVKHVEQKPDLSVRVRKMRTDVVLPEATGVMLPPNEVTVFAGSRGDNSAQTQSNGVTILPDVDLRDFSKVEKVILSAEQAAQGVDIPQAPVIKIEPIATQTDAVAASSNIVQPSENTTDQAYLTTPVVAESTITTPGVAASYNSDLPFPSAPDTPNKLVGMVLSAQSELITDAIVEIHAPDGTIARAVKTNALGQFFISTPLGDGEYTLVAEKEGFTFEPQQLTLTGGLVPPIEVRSV